MVICMRFIKTDVLERLIWYRNLVEIIFISTFHAAQVPKLMTLKRISISVVSVSHPYHKKGTNNKPAWVKMS